MGHGLQRVRHNRRLLIVSWVPRRSNQSILKEIKLEHPVEKTLMLGKIEGKRRSEPQRMRWLDRFFDSMDMNLSKLQEIVKDRGAWHAIVHGAAKNQTWLSDWRQQFVFYLMLNPLDTEESLFPEQPNPYQYHNLYFCSTVYFWNLQMTSDSHSTFRIQNLSSCLLIFYSNIFICLGQ